MCQHLPCRFSSDTFFEGVCCVRFLRYCDLSVFASLLDVYQSRYQTLECTWNCVLGYTCRLCSLRGCCHRERLLSLYRGLCRRPGYFVSSTMGCVVVTEPFDLTVVGGRHPFNVATRMQTHIGSICEPRRVDTFVICLSPTA